MSDLQLPSNHSITEKIELPTFDLPQNYSILINKLEQLAFGLDSALGNLSLDRKEIEIAVHGSSNDFTEDLIDGPIAAGRAPPPHPHAHGDVEYSRVVSDVWIGVILTLLIVSVIFFICSCFLFHKFQQWKNQYRTNPSEPVEICRRYGPDFEAESLPSYTIVSGLPTYDDALEEFRKAGIILTPTATPTPVIKIFESDSKDNQTFYNLESGLNNDNISGDNISLSSTCTCGASAAANSATPTPNNSYSNLGPQSQVIELSPEQLATLSQKRLSLQIAFNNNINPVRRNSRPRVDLYREVINRNSILRSRAVGNTAGLDASIFPTIHRSSSTFSLANPNGPRLHHHRGSLC